MGITHEVKMATTHVNQNEVAALVAAIAPPVTEIRYMRDNFRTSFQGMGLSRALQALVLAELARYSVATQAGVDVLRAGGFFRSVGMVIWMTNREKLRFRLDRLVVEDTARVAAGIAEKGPLFWRGISPITTRILS